MNQRKLSITGKRVLPETIPTTSLRTSFIPTIVFKNLHKSENFPHTILSLNIFLLLDY